IADPQIGVARRLHRPREILERGLPIAPRRVRVHDALDLARFEEPWDRPLLGGLDLAQVLAKLRRDPVEIERTIDRFLIGASLRARRALREEAVLVELEPPILRA